MEAHSQLVQVEKDTLTKYATDKMSALEIGTYMGGSANIIAKALRPEGKLYCVDPFPDRKGKKDPGWTIAERDLKRNGIFEKVIFLRGLSTDPAITSKIPKGLDFVFVDGDHSYQGLANDWNIVKECVSMGGIVCLHDTLIPPLEPYRKFGSTEYFEDIVRNDPEFQLIETSYSMTILCRIARSQP